MLLQVPAWNRKLSESNTADVLSKMTVLENSVSAFMKQQSQEMKALRETVGALGPLSKDNLGNRFRNVHESESVDTPSKKRKVEEIAEKEAENNVEAEPVSNKNTYSQAAQGFQPAGTSQTDQPSGRQSIHPPGTTRNTPMRVSSH